MEKNIISENLIKGAIDKVLFEQMSKVSRQDFSRVQFKIEELQNSLGETVKELRKLEDSIPGGLQTLTKSRVSMISSNLINSQKILSILKDKVRQYKRSLYAQSIEEKKK
jgi:septal ring factor EnvC (AmiA/AmiB activator)